MKHWKKFQMQDSFFVAPVTDGAKHVLRAHSRKRHEIPIGSDQVEVLIIETEDDYLTLDSEADQLQQVLDHYRERSEVKLSS